MSPTTDPTQSLDSPDAPHAPRPPETRSKTDHINIAGDAMTLGTADYPDEHRSLVRWLYDLAKQSGWSWSDLESRTGISTTTLYRVWLGKYRNPETGVPVNLTSLCDTISRFRELHEDRAAAQAAPFIETSVFRRIAKVSREALVMQAIACIYGESQIGKTASLREVQRRNNHGQTTYVLMPTSAGVQSMTKAIALACHISANTCFESLRERVGNYFDGTKLLIIDEIHEAFVSYQRGSMLKCLSFLRQLQETSQCGLVLCGTNVFRTELERGQFEQSLKQLRKRGIWELQLENIPTDEDLFLFAKHYKLGDPSPAARQTIDRVAAEMGLGKYTKFLARSAKLAADKKERFTWDHFIRTVSIADKLRTPPQPARKP